MLLEHRRNCQPLSRLSLIACACCCLFLLANPHITAASAKFHFISTWGRAGTGTGEFRAPVDVAVAGRYVFVADIWNNRIQEFDTNGKYITQWQAELDGIGIGPGRTLWTDDSEEGKIKAYRPDGTLIRSWGSYGSKKGQFGNVWDVAVYSRVADSTGYVYVADAGKNLIEEFDTSGNFIKQWGSTGAGDGQFSGMGPASIAVDNHGFVYVSDTGNNRIEKFDSGGNYVAQWGSVPGDGQLSNPEGLSTDDLGHVYVNDRDSSRVVEYDSDGKFIKTWGWGVQNGRALFQVCTRRCTAGLEGAGWGQFGLPQGVAADPKGNVYVADTDNNRIERFGG